MQLFSYLYIDHNHNYLRNLGCKTSSLYLIYRWGWGFAKFIPVFLAILCVGSGVCEMWCIEMLFTYFWFSILYCIQCFARSIMWTLYLDCRV